MGDISIFPPPDFHFLLWADYTGLLSLLAPGVGCRYISNVRRWQKLPLLLLGFEYVAVWYFPASKALWRAWEPVVCAFWSSSSRVRQESQLAVPADMWTQELFLRTASWKMDVGTSGHSGFLFFSFIPSLPPSSLRRSTWRHAWNHVWIPAALLVLAYKSNCRLSVFVFAGEALEFDGSLIVTAFRFQCLKQQNCMKSYVVIWMKQDQVKRKGSDWRAYSMPLLRLVTKTHEEFRIKDQVCFYTSHLNITVSKGRD